LFAQYWILLDLLANMLLENALASIVSTARPGRLGTAFFYPFGTYLHLDLYHPCNLPLQSSSKNRGLQGRSDQMIGQRLAMCYRAFPAFSHCHLDSKLTSTDPIAYLRLGMQEPLRLVNQLGTGCKGTHEILHIQ